MYCKCVKYLQFANDVVDLKKKYTVIMEKKQKKLLGEKAK